MSVLWDIKHNVQIAIVQIDASTHLFVVSSKFFSRPVNSPDKFCAGIHNGDTVSSTLFPIPIENQILANPSRVLN